MPRPTLPVKLRQLRKPISKSWFRTSWGPYPLWRPPSGHGSPEQRYKAGQPRRFLAIAAIAPSRVVLTYPRNDKAAAERTTALRQGLLPAAKVEVVKVEAVDASRPMPGIGYYFRSYYYAALDVSHRLQPLLGPVEPALLELRGKVPPPGTVEIAVPGRGAR